MKGDYLMDWSEFIFETAMLLLALACVVYIQKQVFKLMAWYIIETNKRDSEKDNKNGTIE